MQCSKSPFFGCAECSHQEQWILCFPHYLLSYRSTNCGTLLADTQNRSVALQLPCMRYHVKLPASIPSAAARFSWRTKIGACHWGGRNWRWLCIRLCGQQTASLAFRRKASRSTEQIGASRSHMCSQLGWISSMCWPECFMKLMDQKKIRGSVSSKCFRRCGWPRFILKVACCGRRGLRTSPNVVSSHAGLVLTQLDVWRSSGLMMLPTCLKTTRTTIAFQRPWKTLRWHLWRHWLMKKLAG